MSSVKICDSILMALCRFGKPVPQNPVPTLVAYIDLECGVQNPDVTPLKLDVLREPQKNRKQE